VREKSELVETSESVVDTRSIETEETAHALAAVIGGAVLVGSEGEENEHSGCVGGKTREPPVVKEVGLEPAEGAAVRST
jgi:hypothetical protein